LHKAHLKLLTWALGASILTTDGLWATAWPPNDEYKEWSTEKEIFVPMRDGMHLSTDLLRPLGASGKLPTILVRTPYDKDHIEWPSMRGFLEVYLKRGYAVALQNERGRFFSEGNYDDYLRGASTDGYDTVDWIAKQPWSNGKVGTIGCSSAGQQQWVMAAGNHPGHAAMIPAGTWAVGNIPGNETRGAFYRGGVPLMGFWASWYNDRAPSERLLLPPNSTREQRIRLRNGYSLQTRPYFETASGASIPRDSRTCQARTFCGQ